MQKKQLILQNSKLHLQNRFCKDVPATNLLYILLELFDKHNEDRKLQVGVNLHNYTYRIYCTTRSYLADFIKLKYNFNDIPLKEVNRSFIEDFET